STPVIRRAPPPPLFPYTTLFRSPRALARQSHRLLALAARRRGAGAELDPLVRARARAGRRRGLLPAWVLARGPRAHADRRLLPRSEEHTSELQSRENLVCRLLLE